jgi:hypothetical protein
MTVSMPRECAFDIPSRRMRRRQSACTGVTHRDELASEGAAERDSQDDLSSLIGICIGPTADIPLRQVTVRIRASYRFKRIGQ